MKITRRSLIISGLFVALFLTIAAIPDEEALATNPSPKPMITTKKHPQKKLVKDKIKVTFIELGSVKCIPCKMMQPIMEEIARDYQGQVKVVFYDVWAPEGKSSAEKYQVRAIPTQVFLDKNGKEYYRHVGFFPKDDLVRVLMHKGVK